MVALNSKGEVADLLSVNQFISGRSAYECVAYSGALAKYAGKPGSGPTGTATEASNLAQQWYATEEGSNLASNMNGMSLPAEYAMLTGMGLKYQTLSPTVAAVKQALSQGYPVLLCGAETGFYDMDLGAVPYSWTPSGNHCILASGIASDGNLLVHDCASIASTGVRPGPRRYSASKMQIVSATAVIEPWIGDVDVIDIDNSWVKMYFSQTNSTTWHCAKTNQDLSGDLLTGWRTMAGSPRLPTKPVVKYGNAASYQECESGVLVCDPGHEIDSSSGPWAPCYLLKLDSPLAVQLLGSVPTANEADAITQLKQIYGDAQTGLKDLGQ